MDQQEMYLAHQAIGALFSATNKLQVQGSNYLQELSIRQSMVMATLVHLPQEEATINTIARLLGTSKQSAKQIIDAMEKKGYVAVGPNAQDKRALSVTITPEGARVNQRCVQRYNDFAAEAFKDFDPGDLETMLALLAKLRGGTGDAQADQAASSRDVFVTNMNHYLHSHEATASAGSQEGAKR